MHLHFFCLSVVFVKPNCNFITVANKTVSSGILVNFELFISHPINPKFFAETVLFPKPTINTKKCKCHRDCLNTVHYGIKQKT